MISLIIPIYNFESHLPQSLETLRAWLKGRTDVLEIIFVDDGSTDRTAEILKTLPAPMRTITLSANQGKGAAVRAGVLASRGEYVFFTDADLPYDLKAVDAALARFAQGADVVLGSRYVSGSAFVAKRSAKRKISSAIFSWLANIILLERVEDTQCGFKGFQTAAAQKIFGGMKTADYSFDVEMIYRAQHERYSIALMPVTLVEESVSSIHILRDGFSMGISLSRLYIRTRGAGIRRHDLVFISGMGMGVALFLIPLLQNLGVMSALQKYGVHPALAIILLFITVPISLLVLTFVLSLLPLHHKSAAQLSRYAVVGFFNTALNAAIFNVLMLFSGVSRGPLVTLFAVITFVVVVTQAFFWNMLWTFRTESPQNRVQQYKRFLLVSSIVATFNIAFIHVLVNEVGAPAGIPSAAWANIALACTIVSSVFGNFLGYKFLVFSK